jgi:hypothetical protein
MRAVSVVASICTTPSGPSEAASFRVAGRAEAIVTRREAAARADPVVPFRASKSTLAALRAGLAVGAAPCFCGAAASEAWPNPVVRAVAVSSAVAAAIDLIFVDPRTGYPHW